MCLERAFSGYLAYFFEVGLGGDTKGLERGKEGDTHSFVLGTWPPLSTPPANSFVIGTAVINTHTVLH